jgi:hypothetical protein
MDNLIKNRHHYLFSSNEKIVVVTISTGRSIFKDATSFVVANTMSQRTY